MRIIVWIIPIIMCANTADCYKFLFILPYGSASHKTSMDPIAIELGKRGHHVTMMSTVKTIPNMENVTNIILERVKQRWLESNFTFFDQGSGTIKVILNLYSALGALTNATYQEPEIIDVIREPLDANGKSKFDLVIVDAILNEFALPIAHRLGVPAVYLSPSSVLPAVAWHLNIPSPFAYIPYLGLDFVTDSPFVTRLKTTLVNVAFLLFQSFYAAPGLDEIICDAYRRLGVPRAPSIGMLEKNISLLLGNSHFSFAAQIPTTPYYYEIGGVTMTPAKQLPEEFEDIMQSSGDHGVIYFSLGSFTRGDAMPIEMRDKMIKVFNQLPQTIIWKYEQEIRNQSNNIKSNVHLKKWVPQRDLLGHPKLRLFITHGGGLSLQEAVYNGCPLLGFPLSADQPGNMAFARSRGFGEQLDWKTFTAEELLEKINKMINNKSYKENAVKASKLLRDRPDDPVNTAVYWLLYVIRHQGATHLKTGADSLNLFQYFLLDVMAVIVLSVALVLWISIYIFRKSVIVVRFLVKTILSSANLERETTHSKKLKRN